MVRVIIDGRSVELPEGTTILAAAESAGCDIPTLCHVKGLTPDPVCRVCTVEVELGGRTSMLTACSRPIAEGMEVRTRSERVLHHRRVLIQLLLARSMGAPELLNKSLRKSSKKSADREWGRLNAAVRELAEREGIDSTPFRETLPAESPSDDCILCGRCVRACREITGAEVLGWMGRGFGRRVALPFDEPSDDCVSCAACATVCPTGCIGVEDEEGREVRHDELLLGPNSAIRVGTYQAVPSQPYVDPDSCIHLRFGECGVCERVCDQEAIDLGEQERFEKISVGSIVVATGFQTFDPTHMRRYGYGRLPDVVTTLEMERMLNAAGPTGGKVRLSKGGTPRRVAIVHCVGSRDQNEHEYCSRVCCMVALKQAHLLRERTGAEVFSFYIDLRCFGKGYEEFYHRTLREGVRFVRGKVATVEPASPGDDGTLVVRAEDTLLGQTLRVPVDLVILAVGLEAAEGTIELARKLGLSVGRDGWLLEQHPKLGPVSTAVDGIFLAGACQGPKDIPDAVSQGLAAAARAMSLADRGEVEIAGSTAWIDPELCAGCRQCADLCPVRAINFDERMGVSVVEERLCQGCGACAAQCRSGAASARHFTDEQLLAELEGMLR
jgi:heterodisulfide reductase subunit A